MPTIPEKIKDAATGGSPVGTFLLGAFSLLAALLTALGTVNGGIARIERNNGRLLIVGIALIFAAISIGACAALVSGGALKLKRLHRNVPLWSVYLLGVLALLTGLILVTIAAGTDVAERPSITLRLSKDKDLGLVLTGAVKATDVASNDHIEVRIDELGPNRTATSVYAAAFGPSGSGDVEHGFTVPLKPGTEGVFAEAGINDLSGDCFGRRLKIKAATNTVGCVHLRVIPDSSSQPTPTPMPNTK